MTDPRRRPARRGAALLALSLLGTALAQEAPPDPFATPPAMRRAGGAREGVAALDSRAGLPPLAVRGVLELVDRPAVALLAVAGETHVVRQGDHLTVASSSLEVSLEVVAIGRGSVDLRVGGPGGPVVTIR